MNRQENQENGPDLRPGFRRKYFFSNTGVILLFFLILMVMTGACTSILANHLDTIIVNKVDDFFELREKQEEQATRQIRRLLRWARSAGIDQARAFLQGLRSRILGGFEEADIRWIDRETDKIFSEVYERLIPEMAAFLVTVSRKQVLHCSKALAEENESLVERCRMDPEERSKERFERFIDTLEDWTGDLEDEQIATIKKRYHASVRDTTCLRLRYNRWRQKDFLSKLWAETPRKELQKYLENWLSGFPHSLPEWYRKVHVANNKARSKLLLVIDDLLTKKQRNHAAAHCRELIEKLEGFR